MTVRDIQRYLAHTVGTELSHDTISRGTEEVRAWQSRPLEGLYPVIYLDALRNKAAHIAVGDRPGRGQACRGIWVQAAEGAKFWAGIRAELRNRGVRDVLVVCCDGPVP